jgi:FKBP-type peptidyl-prolyl cis-trans isomerase 2
MSGANMGGSPQPGQAQAQAALEELKMGMDTDAASKLEAALGLAQGDLKEAIEHALEDLNAGKPAEAHVALEKALGLGR